MIKYFFTGSVVYMSLLLLFSPVFYAVTCFDLLPVGSPLRLFGVPTVILMLILIIAVIPYFSHQVAKRHAFESRSMGASLSGALNDARFRLCFLPLIGNLFIRDEGFDRHDKE